MNPDQLSVKGTESGEQKAVMAWAAVAMNYGFDAANGDWTKLNELPKVPVPQLRWLHAIPNGGARDPVTAARLKAEGVKAGVPDLFLPIAKWLSPSYAFHGLYIEMKKGVSGRQSKEQIDFEAHCMTASYRYVVCRNWREAADALKDYLT